MAHLRRKNILNLPEAPGLRYLEGDGDQKIVGQRSGSSNPGLHWIWRAEEDQKLKEAVSQMGPQYWDIIAQKIPGRSGESCKHRWFNHLDPRFNRQPFTAAETDRLLAAHAAHGGDWKAIGRLFPGRTHTFLKNNLQIAMVKNHREEIPANQVNVDGNPIRISVAGNFNSEYSGGPLAVDKTVATSGKESESEETSGVSEDDSAGGNGRFYYYDFLGVGSS
ncbi:transcription factor CSA-like [Andrographis paniculata]|uniref:transcription factor CSA-like n=1 Tax=Andrographis paniculata TaxID=175694 RepID=UPI0021E969D7|nr:transcription factor CSA-like [Andrographis paniculata]